MTQTGWKAGPPEPSGGRGEIAPEPVLASVHLHNAVLDLERVLRELQPSAVQVRAVLDEALTLCRRSLEEIRSLPTERSLQSLPMERALQGLPMERALQRLPAERPPVPRALRPAAARGGSPEMRRLTPREREVVRYAAEGKSNGAIAIILGISARTVETHRTKAMQKLGLESLVELVHYAVRQKLVEP